MSRLSLLVSPVVCCLVALTGCSSSEGESSPPSPPASAPADSSSYAAPQTPPVAIPAALTAVETEAGCGKCIYGMEVSGCPTAVLVAGKPMLIEGPASNAHSLGLCGGAKMAVVTGKVEGDVLMVEDIKLQ